MSPNRPDPPFTSLPPMKWPISCMNVSLNSGRRRRPLSRSIVTAFFTAVTGWPVCRGEAGRGATNPPYSAAAARWDCGAKSAIYAGVGVSDGLFYRPRSPGCGGGRTDHDFHGRRPANVYQRPRDDPATPPRRKPRRGPGTRNLSANRANPVRSAFDKTFMEWPGRPIPIRCPQMTLKLPPTAA